MLEGQYSHISVPVFYNGNYYTPGINFDFAVRRWSPNPNYKQNMTVYIKNIEIIFGDKIWSKYYKNRLLFIIRDSNGSSTIGVDMYKEEIDFNIGEDAIVTISKTITSSEIYSRYESVISSLTFYIDFYLIYKNGYDAEKIKPS